VALSVDRHTLAKRRWRGRAVDGEEFGFELHDPLTDGAVFFESATARYVIEQQPEPLLAIALTDPESAARIAWQIGNLHFPVAVKEGRILVENDLAIRQMLERDHVPFEAVEAVFQPLNAGAGHHHHHETASPRADHSH
jgi:urease accessory protein